MDASKTFWKQMSLCGNIWQWINSIRKIRWNRATKFIQIALLDILTWLHHRLRSQIIKAIQLPFPSVIVFNSILMMAIGKGNIPSPLPIMVRISWPREKHSFPPGNLKSMKKDRKTNSISRREKHRNEGTEAKVSSDKEKLCPSHV